MAESNPRHRQFQSDCERAGLVVTFYEGRNFYRGPAVICDNTAHLQRVVRATRTTLTTDQMGKDGFVCYPK
jgi:hypothetical protein